MSDAAANAFAQAPRRIQINPRAITGNLRIDETSVKLANILGPIADAVDRIPNLTSQEYGRVVHEVFGATVRALNLPGIGIDGVETTFPTGSYGARGSIRTDVALRDEFGRIIAIYDVKTGERGLDPARVAQLRAKTGVGSNVPVFEISVLRGLSRKHAFSGTPFRLRIKTF